MRGYEDMLSYRYLEDCDVHFIDYSGRVDLAEGLARWKALQLELEARPLQGSRRKLLIDFRNTVWESEEVHMQLSAMTRREFGLDSSNEGIRVAIVNDRWSGPVAPNEHWFSTPSEALAWLRQA